MNYKKVSFAGDVYQYDHVQFGSFMNNRLEEFRKNKTEKGSFYCWIEKETDIPEATIKSWKKGISPKQSMDRFLHLLEILNVSDDEKKLILKPLTANTENKEKKQIICTDVDKLKDSMKELGVSNSMLLCYLGFYKGYSVSYVTVVRIMKGKIIPSQELLEDIWECLTIMTENRSKEKKLAFCDGEETNKKEYRHLRALWRKFMEQYGITVGAMNNYLEYIKNYDISYVQTIKMLLGMLTPTSDLVNDVNDYITKAEMNVLGMDFPMTEEQFYSVDQDSKICGNIKYKKVIGLVITRKYGIEGVVERVLQAVKMGRICKNNGIDIKMHQVRYLRDAQMYEIKDALNMVEWGYYDALFVYDEDCFISELCKIIVVSYAKIHKTPVVFLTDLFYTA